MVIQWKMYGSNLSFIWVNFGQQFWILFLAKFLLLQCKQKVLEQTLRNLKSSKHFLGAEGGG